MSKQRAEKSDVPARTEVIYYVTRAEKGNGWVLVRMTVRGDSVIERKVEAGPDLRKIVLAKAIVELARN